VLADFRVYLNTFLLKSYIHFKLNMLGLILTTTIACSRHFTHVLSSRPSQSWWMRVRRCASEIYCSKLTISFLMLLFGKGTIFCWTDTNRHRQTRFSSTNLKPNKFCEVSLLLKKFCPFHLRLQRNFAWPCYWELRSSSPWIIIWKY